MGTNFAQSKREVTGRSGISAGDEAADNKPPRLQQSAEQRLDLREEDVEIRFDAEIAWRVEERTFHPDEDKTLLPDGTLVYRVRSSAQWEIIPWVLGFGALAELVAPVAWRDAMRANLEATVQRYRPT